MDEGSNLYRVLCFFCLLVITASAVFVAYKFDQYAEEGVTQVRDMRLNLSLALDHILTNTDDGKELLDAYLKDRRKQNTIARLEEQEREEKQTEEQAKEQTEDEGLETPIEDPALDVNKDALPVENL